MAPANTSFATATLISSLPANILQSDINDGGVNFTVFYRFIAPTNARVIGAWAFSGNVSSGYRPRILPYNGPAGAPTQILSINFQNKPIQFPVVPGQEYFIEIRKDIDTAGPEQIRLQMEVAPLDDISAGNILVNDDTTGFPLAVLSQDVDHKVINFVKDIAAGEGGDIATDAICLERFTDNTIRIYNKATFAEIGNLSMATGQPRIRTCKGLNKFYVAIDRNPVQIRDILRTGVYGAVNLITTLTNCRGFAVSNDGLIGYNSSTASASPVRRWDMVGNVAMADLAAGVANQMIVDILVLTDNSIVVLYEVFGGGTVVVRRYDAAGTLLNTFSNFDINIEPAGTFARLAYALDDPVSFWLWNHPATGVSNFINVRIADGVFVTKRVHTEFELGGYEAAMTADPTARFGNSFSCPFMIMTPTDKYPGIYIFKPDKPNDTVNNSGQLLDLAIPDPTFRTGLLG